MTDATELREKVASVVLARMLGENPTAIDIADAVLALPALADVQALREAAKNAVDCWGVGRLNITAMCGFMDDMRAALALAEGRER